MRTASTMPPVRSHSPSDCAKRLASWVSPARNTRSQGTNTSSKMTKPSGMLWCELAGKSKGLSSAAATLRLMILTPGVLTGIENDTA